MKFELPTWLRSNEITRLKNAADAYWENASEWLMLPLRQLDAETCHPVVVQLLAYQRDVDRFFNEPDTLFRKRVKWGIRNAQDAGFGQGFTRIFERFGIVLAGQIERDPDKPWDVITLVLGRGSGILTGEPALGQFIVRQYGRTCRRYEFLIEDLVAPDYIYLLTQNNDTQNHTLNGPPQARIGDIAPANHITLITSQHDSQTHLIKHNQKTGLNDSVVFNRAIVHHSIDYQTDIVTTR